MLRKREGIFELTTLDTRSRKIIELLAAEMTGILIIIRYYGRIDKKSGGI
ncbi:hypothetical protein T458_03080 [Brevibacillus panacihumi W25]|uniref:Uncharacterized protein n=1 Tax=Brevibacillus panacihumi W25 TaxID=1408254 RepID=V6MFQ6_9BACL|nr:hypothetical protein T458_03080 [Brevibacillus panacihumi W25]